MRGFEPGAVDLSDHEAQRSEIARLENEGVERRTREEALHQALDDAVRSQDADFGAVEFSVRWMVPRTTVPAYDGDDFEEDILGSDAAEYGYWVFSADDGELDLSLSEALIAEARNRMAGWLSHFGSLGLLRADNLDYHRERKFESPSTADFVLVYRAEDCELGPECLAFAEEEFELAAIKGARIKVSCETRPVNATRLFRAVAGGGVELSLWGGEATPQLEPAPEESRADWLDRICIPHERLARLVERWRRSGGNPALFAAAGAGGGDANKDRPIEFIVPGLIPRGYVTLLAGTKQAGKSTLLGEILAVIDSECQEARFVLGTEVTARGVSCMVSGEDGMDFISSRNAYYEPVHGPGQGFVFDTAERPWAEVLQLLYAIPRVDIIGIDGLRAVMPGNEDSSEAISKFFDDLNALARYHRCAIVLVHHLSKSQVRSLAAMLPAVRGSGAITDRVRVAIGMIDRGANVTEVGIIKHNIPPSEEVWGEINGGRHFRRDETTLTLVPIDTAARASSRGSGEAGAIECIVEAISHFNRLGVVLRQTGKRELFEQKPPQLVGLARGTIREGVTALLNLGRVSDGPEGLKTQPSLAAAGA